MAPSLLSILGAGFLAVSVNAATAGRVCTSTRGVDRTTTYTDLVTSFKTTTPKAATVTVVVNGTATYTEYASSSLASSASSSSAVLSTSTSVTPTSSSITSSSTGSRKAKRGATACTSTYYVTTTRRVRVHITKTVTSTITAAQSTVTKTRTVENDLSSSSSSSSKSSSNSSSSSKSSSNSSSTSKSSSNSSSSSKSSSSSPTSNKPSTTAPATGPSCTARNQLTDITTDCSSYSSTPYCAIHEGSGVTGQCMSCVPLNNICTSSTQCCAGFSCSTHDSNDFGYCRPYSAHPTGLSAAAPSKSTSTSSSKTTSSSSSSTTKKTTTTTSTKTSSAAAVASSTTKAQSCDIDEVSDGTNTWLYVKYYSGSGYTLSPTNGGNSADGFPPVTTTFAASMTDCQAIAACAQSAVDQKDNYWSFGLWREDDEEWTCVMYVNGNDDAAAWSVGDEEVSKAYGFSVHGV